MHLSFNNKNFYKRNSFKKNKDILEIPNLLSIQKESFNKFIKNTNFDSGIHYILKLFFPIKISSKNIIIEYINYTLDKPIFNKKECKLKGFTYSSSLKINFSITNDDKIYNVENIHICDIPIMTDNCSFIINGTERVLVSQLHRSPGVFFGNNKDKLNFNNKLLYSAKIIPYRGSWIDIEFDSNNNLFFRIDKKKKIPLTTLLHALSLSNDDILKYFYTSNKILIKNNNLLELNINLSDFYNNIIPFDIILNENFIINKGSKIIDKHIKLQPNDIKILVSWDFIYDKICYKSYFDNNNNIILKSNELLNYDNFNKLIINNIKELEIISLKDFYNKNLYISNTLKIDNTVDEKTSLIEIYKNIKSGELPIYDNIKLFFNNLFFNKDKYSLSKSGRMKLNLSLSRDKTFYLDVLDKIDILNTIKKLIDIKNGIGNVDDIDNLCNRRVRLVGEMIENQFRLAISKLEKCIKDKISFINENIDLINIQDLINPKYISSIIKDFFTSSQLSQFMDQNNPLSDITHKRRISALGSGGLTKERANFEVRDVHYSHYGKLCPIETPEGPNIGLINSLSIYSRINEYGLLETPYRKVSNGLITNNINYLSSIEEFNFIIAQADIKIDSNNIILDENIMCRYRGESVFFNKKKINYIDISTQQMISVGTSLIPFLEHNDANRALMGANMQRQSVPLLITEPPLVGTGIERRIAIDSGVLIIANRGGIVSYIDSKYIIIEVNDCEILNDNDICIDIYELNKFDKSNQNTCINQKPCINLYDSINKGDILADGQSTYLGELSLGKNIRVAFMPWNGYNFEDSIVISEDLIKKDIFTSIHIYELICIVRETKLGSEITTKDISNINDTNLSKLNNNGIINVGSYVNEGDILVGKITPKGEIQLTPEEKLLKAIFGDKKLDTKDTSLKVPSGLSGIVIDTKIFIKSSNKNNNLELDKNKFIEYKNTLKYKNKIIKLSILKYIKKLFNNFLNINEFNINNLEEFINNNNIKYFNNNKFKLLKNLFTKYINLDNELDNELKLDFKKNNNIDDLSPGILKIIKIYIANKKYIQAGDKIAGRHGNKGVISKICPIEDMPYDENGNHIDMILNPLGVPSRMNVGQILETHLGLASKEIGNIINNLIINNNINELKIILNKVLNYYKFDNKIDFDNLSDVDILNISNSIKNGLYTSTPAFDGANEFDIKYMLKLSGFSDFGQISLYDGYTGNKIDRNVTVGYMYMMKLNHLVDDKIHSRSTGSYSLITQQPLGGKSQFGGQRFGEMEVWALEAYGAAYTLQEMLTVKSDDISGRVDMYKNIINENYSMNPNIPESFNVLLKEIRALGLDIDLKKK